MKIEETIKEIVMTLLRKAFYCSISSEKSLSLDTTFNSLGLSYTDIVFFIDDFILREGVPFFTVEHPQFYGDGIRSMVYYIYDCYISSGGNDLSGKVFFGMLLYDIQTKKRDKFGVAIVKKQKSS